MNVSGPPSPWAEAMRRRIGQALEDLLAARPQTEVLRAARYVAQGGGHRWRGLMAAAAGAMFRADAEDCVLPLAAALELMHAASLVLDDLPSMDDAKTRRGKPCVHLVFPRSTADMLPAFLVNLAYRVVAEAPQASAECRIRCLSLLGEMGEHLAQGQELDLAPAAAPVSESALLERYALKSGSLFAAALAGGGLLCGAGADEARALREAGLNLGRAYQILDDIADGEEESGKRTALSLFGPAAARARAEQLLSDAGRLLDRFGPAAGPLRELLGAILAQAPQ
jgi:geranylgeranyl pyrophosphate synthase